MAAEIVEIQAGVERQADGASPFGVDSQHDVAVHPRIVPEGYLLTTRAMSQEYWHVFDGCGPGEHRHPEHTVFWPSRGAASVEVAGRIHQLTEGQGLWLPPHTSHVVRRDPSSTMTVVHIVAGGWERPEPEIRAVGVCAALRELLIHLMPTHMPMEQRLRAQRVCLELFADASQPTLQVTIPQDGRIRVIAEAILADPADDRSIEDFARLVSASGRTVARAFRASTGMTFSAWRTRARMAAAVELLGRGLPVGTVSRRVGYNGIGAFSTAFHREVGCPPRDCLPGAR